MQFFMSVGGEGASSLLLGKLDDFGCHFHSFFGQIQVLGQAKRGRAPELPSQPVSTLFCRVTLPRPATEY